MKANLTEEGTIHKDLTKDPGLRYIRNALSLGTRNEARVAELVGRLPMLLAYAQEITARRGEAA